ncbi:hypothetical protein [Nitrosopumilus sp.]|uniref:hypothetical protein n=1 Tax=Nitrosopumilus sp. TaxID=2024843 RepID=UPI0034A0211C
MVIAGMYMLNSAKYTEEKINKALEILYTDRKNEFHELSQICLGKKNIHGMPYWREFILNFCLDVEDSFKTWTGQKPPSVTSPQKALTILRQIGNGMTSMNKLTHMLNLSYNLSMEFKEIYKRLK